MSVGLLLLTHGDIGQSIYNAATHILGNSPVRTGIIAINAGDDWDVIETEINETLIELDSGQGVLVLTDMYGATPSNLACSYAGLTVEIVAGLNLPMLVRVMNYPDMDLDELKQKAISGGKQGIVPFRIDKARHASQGN